MSNTEPESIGETQPVTPNKRSTLRWILRQTCRGVALLGVVTLLLVIGFGLYAWRVNTDGDEAVRRVATELDQRELSGLYPDSLPGNNAEGFAPDERGTSASYWRAAMEAAPHPGDRPLPAVAIVAYTGTEPRQQYHPDVVAAMREAVDEAALFYELVDRAQQAEQAPFLPEDPIQAFEGNLGLLGDSRRIARWMQVRAALAEVENDGQAFVQSYLAPLALNNNLQSQPNMIVELVRISIDALVRGGVVEGLSRITLTPEELDTLIAALEARKANYDAAEFMARALSAEFHIVGRHVPDHIRYQEAKQDIVMRDLPADVESFIDLPEEPGLIGRLWGDALLNWAPGRYQSIHADQMLRAIEEYDQIAALRAKPKDQWDMIVRLTEARDQEEEDVSAFDPRALRVNLLAALRTIVRSECRLDVAIAALKVERYRVAHGDWPSKLSDATGETTTDARGQEVLYRQTPEGVVVYSVGDNLIDEQGYNKYEYVGSSQFPDADDYPAVLYNPALRNALPPPEQAIMDYDDTSLLDLGLQPPTEAE
ncbi:MAG: hypothetical protein AAGA29_02590 [Planctomycetota bacterium]